MSKELIRLSDCRMVFDDEVVLNSINLYINDKAYLKECYEKGAEFAMKLSQRTLDKAMKKIGFVER